MRKYIVNSVALLVAISLCAFTVEKRKTESLSSIYLIYLGGNHTLVGNYAQQTTAPDDCWGSANLCWIWIDDIDNDGFVSQSEFDYVLSQIDTDSDNSLDDEAESSFLQKKGFW
jgi:hypothetical protein